jgi:hypothetical protein
MASDELIAFIEGKFEEHGVSKVIPEDDILELHARRMIERQMVLRALDGLLPSIREQAAKAKLPDDLRRRVEEQFENRPELPWDAAIAEILKEDDDHVDEEVAAPPREF